jgi:uncharacterized protein YlxW (UPF0749 family)
MRRVSVKRYAVENKMSIFSVIKAIRNGTLPSETVTEDGKETTYVLVDEKSAEKDNTRTEKRNTQRSLQEEVETLKNEVETLKREVARLRSMVMGGVLQ